MDSMPSTIFFIDDDYEVIDSGPPKSLVQQVLTLDLSRQPTYTQALVGGASGWFVDYLLSIKSI